MRPDELILTRYFFPIQTVTANSSHVEGDDIGARYHINAQTSAKHDADGTYKLTVLIGVANDDECDNCDNDPYAYELVAVGFFEYAPDTAEHKNDEERAAIETSAKVFGGQVLFGAIRERLAELTARGPWGPIFLSTLNVEHLRAALDQEQQDE